MRTTKNHKDTSFVKNCSHISLLGSGTYCYSQDRSQQKISAMGCVGSVNVSHEESLRFMEKWRGEGKGRDFLLMGIKDQNMVGKVYFSGAATADPQLVASLDAVLKKTRSDVCRGRDEFDHLWDLVWHNTRMTSGYQFMSMKKPFFPIGKHVVELMDILGSHAWVPFASPNYGGPMGDKASVDWPMIILKKDPDGLYEKETLFFAVKDQNIPGKLCACGPPEVVEQLRTNLTNKLRQASKDVQEGFDDYDTASEWDIVWRNTSITSGMQAFSMAKPYFPKGKVVLSMLTEVYKLGWELVCCPNFGGNEVDWPCFIFKRLKSQALRESPLVFAAVKDQNVPGKLCLSVTPSHLQDVTNTIAQPLQRVKGNEGLKSEKDEYDADHDQVLRNTSITTGMQAFSFKTAYFPRNDSVLAITRSMGEKGWKLAACPMFGGMGASWPCFVWHYTGKRMQTALVAVKDQNWPGKVCVGGVEKEVANALLVAFKAMSGPDAESGLDSYDQDFDFAIRNTKMTTGSAMCSMQNSWWPYGFPMEVILGELQRFGWEPAGAPAFGSMKLSWPAVIFQREAK
eukprot:Skav205731  [mRNA]  locus=scaffold1496:147395:149101:+ [translate_table: standard]